MSKNTNTTTIQMNIPEDTHKWAKFLAALQGQTIQEFYGSALVAYCDSLKTSNPNVDLEPLYQMFLAGQEQKRANKAA